MGGCVGFGTAYVVKKIIDAKVPEAECYFLRAENKACQVCFIEKKRQCETNLCSYDLLIKIVKLLDSAKRFLDYCSPVTTLKEIAEALLRAKNRGVHVRIICEKISNEVNKLRAYGIPVRELGIGQTVAMHNKFLIVDQKITSIPKVVEFYDNTFEQLWDEQNPIHVTAEMKRRFLDSEKNRHLFYPSR